MEKREFVTTVLLKSQWEREGCTVFSTEKVMYKNKKISRKA